MNTQLSKADVGPVVNREKEIAAVTRRLDQMAADQTVLDCVIFFYGVPQVGKTTLLGKVKSEASVRGIVTASVNFARERTLDSGLPDDQYAGQAGKLQIVKRLWDEFSGAGQIVSHPFTSSDLKPDLDPQIAVERLFSYAYDLAKQRRPFVLLFDTIEDADQDNWFWVQEAIIGRFVKEFQTLAVMGSRTGPSNLIFPLERRLFLFHLRPFDIEQTTQQIEALGVQGKDLPLSVTELEYYTKGLPGFNDAAVRWLVAQKSPDDLSAHLTNIIFKRLAHKTEVDVQAETLAVSPLRQFDAGVLGKIVRELWPDRYAQPGIRPVRELINRLLDTRLVEPHPDGYGYAIPHDLRGVLDDYWRLANPAEHFHIHRIAAQWFADQVAGGDFVAIAGRLYHLQGLACDLHVRADFIKYLPDDLQPDPASSERLTMELRTALTGLNGKQSARAFDIANKIRNVLRQPEFSLIFEPPLLKRLIKQCEDFNNQL